MAILENALSGFFALAGVALLWLLQRRTRHEDLSRQRNAMLREKAEAIFQELERLTDEGAAAVARMSRFAQDPTVSDKALVVDASRLIALMRMYFPDSESIISNYEKKRKHALDAVNKIVSEAAKSYDHESIKGATVMMSITLHTACSEMITSVQAYMHKKAATLVD
jgi:hypothetical protein